MPVRLGLGALRALARHPAAGTVVATFRRATYLRFPGGLVALTGPDVPAGPLHLGCSEHLPFGVLRRHDRVEVVDSCLRGPDFEVDVAGATLWRGELPDRFTPADLDLDLVQEILGSVAGGSGLSRPPFDTQLGPARAAVEAGDLAGAARILGGLGPGLTPSGDDALAGILLAARINGSGPSPWPGIAGGVRTHEISMALLSWAALGQSIEPVHRCLLALAAGDAPAARQAGDELAAVGHTSGADLALGLLWGLTAAA